MIFCWRLRGRSPRGRRLEKICKKLCPGGHQGCLAGVCHACRRVDPELARQVATRMRLRYFRAARRECMAVMIFKFHRIEDGMKTESLCLHAGYEPKNGEPRVVPIAQSTTFRYESTAAVARLFDLEDAGFFYTRLGNPTVDAVERKIAALEGGVGALCTSSGQAANLLALLNVARSGDHIVSASSIYGGTFNLFAVTLKKLGIEVTFVDQTASDEELEKAFRPNTKAVFGEVLTNPSMDVLDIERFAGLAHRHGLPLVVDSTFATPVLCRPFEYGADVVVHSTTKYMDGHALQMGGVIVDSGNFDWTGGKFSEFTEPDPSYHGLVYTEAFGRAAYIVKARVQLMRDMGFGSSP